MRREVLTKTQYGIYIECITNPGTTTYNIPFIQRLSDDTDIGQLCGAVGALVKAHPILSARICADDNGQVCLEEGPEVRADVIRLSNEEFISRREEIVRPFQLDAEPLSRFEIYVTPKASYFFQDIHHLINDGTSMNIIARDLSRAYHNEPLSPESYTIFDASKDEAEKRAAPEFQEQKAYYEALLEGLDTDCAPKPDSEETGVRQGWTDQEFELDEESLSELKTKGISSPGAFFTTVMGYTVAKFNGIKSSVINTVWHGRDDEKTADTVGMFVKTIPFVTDFSEEKLVEGLLRKNAQQLKDTRQRTLYSFADIAESPGITDDIMFVYQGSLLDFSLAKWSGHETEWIFDPLHIESTKMSLELRKTQAGRYCIHMGFRKDVYTEEYAKCFLKAYIRAAKSFLSSRNICDISLVDEEELSLLDSFNDRELPYDTETTVVELFCRSARQFPDRDAVIFEDRHISYSELDSMTDALAGKLRGLGITKEKVVGVLIPRGEYMIICALGVLKAGGAYLPMDNTYPAERLNLMLEDSGAAVLICDRSLEHLISDSFSGARIYTDEIETLPSCEKPEKYPDTADLFVMLYTSGTTGTPKGIMYMHSNMMALCASLRRLYQLDETSVVMQFASYGFDACTQDIYPALTCGGAVCIVPEEMRLDLPVVYEYMKKHKVTHATMTTQLARQFSVLGNPGYLKVMLCGGEKLAPMELPDYQFYNGYGPSEFTVMTTCFLLDHWRKDIPIGLPVFNAKLYVVDTEGKRVPVGASGELWASGPQVTRGYLNRPDKTKEAYGENPFSDDPKYARVFRTGDVVRYLPDGNLQFVGRRDFQVKIRGFRIELTEVEEVIRRFPGIKDAVAVGLDSASGGKFLAAYVVSDNEVDISALNDFILKEKPPYMVPSVTMQIDAVPYTQNHKVNKRALPYPERKTEDLTPPENEVQQKIFDLFAQVSGHEDFGIDTDFYSAGLSSISAVQLNLMLAKEFDLPFTIHELKENCTVRKLEKLIASKAPRERAEEQQSCPLSRTQQGILVECLSRPDSSIYNIPVLYTLDEELDIVKVRRALAEAFAGHPGLFTHLIKDENGNVFAELPGEAADPEGRRRIVLEKIEERSAGSIDEIKDTLVRPFNLFEDTLFRLSLIRADKTFLFADFHHIICDGTSINILMDDVSRAYEGKDPEPELLTGFDVAADEEKRLDSDFYRHARKYYEGLLQDADTDCLPPETVHEYGEKTGEISFESLFSKEVFEDFCKEHQISMSALFNAAFGYTLGKYINREDVTYCTVYNGRSDTRMFRTVSMLVKTFPVRCRTAPERPVKEYITEVAEEMMDSMANDIFSFADIASAFHLGADILFTYQGDLFESGQFCQRPCERETLELDEAKAAIDVEAVIENEILYIKGFYRADIFDQAFMEGFAECVIQAAYEFTKKDKLSDVDILSASMKERVLQLNETDEEIPAEAVHRMFERHVKENPDRCAVMCVNGSLTYQELEDNANRIANALIEKGVSENEIVGLISGRTKEVFTGEMGIMKAGGAFLPIVPEYPDERIDYCLTDAGCHYVLVTDAVLKEKKELFDGKPYRALTIEELLAEGNAKTPETEVSDHALCYCIYTSGTTGKPKGVMIEHRNFRSFAQPCSRNLEAYHYHACGNVVLSVISISFDFSLMEVLLPLCLGKTVCMATEDEIHNPAALARKIRESGVDVVSGTPSFLSSLLDFPVMQDALSGVKLYDLGAESFPSSLYEQMRIVSPDAVIINGYGPTEATISCIAKKLEHGIGITIGKPEANVKAWCMDKEQKLLPVGAMGELVIGGALVGRGYKNLPEKTAQVFVKYDSIPAFRSGDIVRWLSDGEIEFFGRLDNQVKLRGFRVELDEIESSMNSFRGIKSSKVVVRNNGSEDYLAGFFTAECETDISELTAHLRRNLTYYMVPSVLMQLPKMPLTINGKIDKNRLPEVEFSASREYIAPETETEKTVCETFRAVLRLEKVGVTENFFEIGGTSLSATNIVMRLGDMGFEVVYKNIFEFPTPRELAAFISGESKEERVFSDDYDYSGIRRICAYNDLRNVDRIRKKELKGLILTGASGFLGIHVLKEYIQNEKGKVYCLIRKGKYETPELRLQNMLMYYFGDPMKDVFKERIVCIEGDITDPESLEKLKSTDADIVINCAACVRHFASDDILERTNHEGVKNLIDVCLKSKKELIQISTTSVGGLLPENRKHTLLHESDLFIEQTIDNEYIRTKFLAEREVLEACAQKGLKGRIIRVGNLMSRSSDGEFQINFISSSFMRSLKGYKQLGAFPVENLHDPAEFSPVDSTAQAILKIAGSESSFTVFHAYNSHCIYMSDVILALNRYGFRIDIVSGEEFAKKIKDAASDERLSEALLGLIAYDGNGQVLYPAASDNRLTSELLYRLGYFWPITDPPYLNNIIEVLDGFEFFDID